MKKIIDAKSIVYLFWKCFGKKKVHLFTKYNSLKNCQKKTVPEAHIFLTRILTYIKQLPLGLYACLVVNTIICCNVEQEPVVFALP